mgnify:CR=1 FL=1
MVFWYRRIGQNVTVMAKYRNQVDVIHDEECRLTDSKKTQIGMVMRHVINGRVVAVLFQGKIVSFVLFTLITVVW